MCVLGKDEVGVGASSMQAVVLHEEFFKKCQLLRIMLEGLAKTKPSCNRPKGNTALVHIVTLRSSSEERVALEVALVVALPSLEQIPVDFKGLVVGDSHQGAQLAKRFPSAVGVILQTIRISSLNGQPSLDERLHAVWSQIVLAVSTLVVFTGRTPGGIGTLVVGMEVVSDNFEGIQWAGRAPVEVLGVVVEIHIDVPAFRQRLMLPVGTEAHAIKLPGSDSFPLLDFRSSTNQLR